MIQIDQIDGPRLTEDSSSVIGGVVNNVEPHLLQPNQVAYLLNMQSTVEGRRQKRNGVDALGTMGSDLPNGLFGFEFPLAGVQQLAVLFGNSLYRTPGNEVLSRIACGVSFCSTYYQGVLGRGYTNTPGLFLSTCVGMTDNASLPFGNLVFVDKGYNATEVSVVKARAAAWFQGRLWAFNTCGSGVTEGLAGSDFLTWSRPLNGIDFTHGENVQVESDTGDQGTAIVPLRDQTPRMFLFKQRSIHLLDIYWKTDGYYTSTANQLDTTKSIIRPITLETGCVATRGAVWSPGLDQADLLFLSREGIRSLNRSLTDAQGGAGLPLSYRIQRTIDTINWQTADRSCAAYWNGVAYFAVPVNGSIAPNFVLAYDVFRDNWFFLDWRVSAWAPCTLTAERRFYFLGGLATTESYVSGPTNGFHIYNTDTGHIDPGGSPVAYEEHSRAFAFDLEGPGSGLRNRKRWRWLEAAAQAGSTVCTLALYYKVDDDDNWWLHSYIGMDPNDAYPFLPIQLPFGFSTQRMLRRKVSLHQVRPGYKLQFRLLDNTSFADLKLLQLSLVATPYGETFD